MADYNNKCDILNSIMIGFKVFFITKKSFFEAVFDIAKNSLDTST